ncbi:type II secretion system protein M [Methylobacterium currus]|uniref:GspMb/PilO family protein n=1 Tax=Methylobacterium currus TaxID=2051553 RepID=UPI001E59C97F|nr:GspMb/PilO family protein [Methylobacterium currus]UHC17860.1 type II secretion system protein M [Methylobacterium currus]
MHASLEFQISAKIRRILSAIVAAILFLIIACFIINLGLSYLEKRDEISQLRASIVSLSTSASRSSVNIPAAPLEHKLINLFAKNSEEGINHLQKIIRSIEEMIGPNGIRIDSVRILPSLEEDPLVANRVSVAVTVDGEQVFNVINAIEVATPAVIIDILRIGIRTNGSIIQRNTAVDNKYYSKKIQASINLILKTYSEKK